MYQRARAHAALCNEDEARRDFDLVEKLDPKFKPFVRQELKKLGESMRTAHARQNKTYWDTTQERWGPGGSKAKGVATKKKFSQKATEQKKRTEVRKTEDKASSEKPASAQMEGVDDAEAEENPDVEAEQSNKELESGRASGEGLDNENIESVVVQDGQDAPDNRAADKDSDPAPTGAGKDNVVSKRSASDKGRKVKCQSSAAPGCCGTSKGNKATDDKTGNGGTQ